MVATRADITEEQRAGISIDFDPSGHYYPLDWVMALHEDPGAMRRLAASCHPLVRRCVARARHLPADVVERLARDDDRVAQLFLAESCDDAPADMLLRVWQWWTGSLTTPDRPHGHPNFPELVETFSRDSNEEVRYRAASDPRLSPASAVRLLDDPHERVRYTAALHPRLPARVLIRLLRDADTAQTAARHPALPVRVMEQMLQRIQPPVPVTPGP
ncbi:hypothetical protein ACFTXO_32370 [Streptomyces sp. NPDC057067]|uniref:hypothetical protein n=1 Tax=unclassified Streptomyces TaxID=2593676 RepID=UPI003636B6BE